ncbi:MAG: alpha/beta fold hydrolase [Lentisphaeria bacterium]
MKIFILIIVGYLGLVFFMAGCQRSLIYYPERESGVELRRQAEARGLEPWLDSKGTLIGWKSILSVGGNLPAVVIFHGNAGHALYRDYFVRVFQDTDGRMPWDVYIFEYPGYGARDGQLTEQGVKTAAHDAVNSLPDRKDGGGLFLLGESLGCGVACYLAGQKPNRIAGLLLITPFTSLVDVARHHYPFVPSGLLLRHRYESIEPLRNYDGPVAFILAEFDRTIPPEIGRDLYKSYDGPKRLWTQEGKTHNTLDYDPALPWWSEVMSFMRSNNELRGAGTHGNGG